MGRISRFVFKEGFTIHLCSRNGQPLERYFPEVVEGLKQAIPIEMVESVDFRALPTLKHRAHLLRHCEFHGAFVEEQEER